MRSRPRGLRVLAAAMLSLPPAAGGLAQVPADTARRGDTTTVLAPIHVAAPRIAGSSATAPYALMVRTAASLPQGTPAMALDEALRGIPGVQVDNRFNYALGERISVRGAGARAQFGVRGVRVLIDGVPATLPDGQTTLNLIDLGTISRVEVMRGPVASLYGNAAGGALLIETGAPHASPPGARATALRGSDGLLRTLAGAGGARGRIGVDASVSRVAYGGFRTHSTADNRYASARASWLGQRDFVRATFKAVDYDALNPGSLSDSLLRVDRRQAFQNNVNQRTGEAGAQQQAGLQWHRTLGATEALEVTTWVIARGIDNPIPGRVVVVDRRAGGARALLRGARERLAWSAGVEHERQRDDRQNYVNDAGEHGALVLDQDERVSVLGAFGQASIALHPRLTFLAGLRHDRADFRADDRFRAGGDPDDSGRRTLGATSPSAGMSLTLGGGTLLYANAGTAFETPTTTELANRPDGAGGFNPELEPQRTVSYEVGARRSGPAVTVQAAVFRALVRDALIPFEVPDVPGRQFFRNAGRTATSGAEFGVTVRPATQWRLDAAYTFTDSRFRDYTVGATSHAGNRVPGVAPHRMDVTATYDIRGATIAADVRHQSRMDVNDANSAQSGAFTVADFRVATGPLGAGPLGIRAFGGVQNVLATRYNSSVVVNAFGRRYFEPGPGRSLHVGATLEARRR